MEGIVRSCRQYARALAVVLAAVVLNGCAFAIVNPYLRVDDKMVAKDPSLDNAVDYAIRAREQYYRGIAEYTLFNRSAGVALIGMAGAAAALGINGAGMASITHLGIAGGALFGTSRVLYSDRRLQVYAAGAQAITCSIGQFNTVRGAAPTLTRSVDVLEERMLSLAGAIGQVPSVMHGDPRVQSALETLATAQETYGRASAILNMSGARLYDSVERTRAAVNQALLQDEPDLSEIIATASETIRAQATALTGAPGPEVETSNNKKRALANPYEAQLQAIQDLAAQVDAARAHVDLLLSSIGSAPSNEQLDACAFNAEKAGLDFRTEPASLVVVDPKSKDRKSVVVARGGKPPYHAAWIGSLPGTDLEIAPVEHVPGGKFGTITITAAEKPAIGVAYRLLVTDEGAGRVVLTITVGQGAVKPPTSGSLPDPVLLGIQGSLVKFGCLPEKLADGTTSVTGKWDDATDKASRAMAVEQGVTNFDEKYGKPTGANLKSFLAELKKTVDEAGQKTWKECKVVAE
jgi:hypothetical protein